MDCVRFGPTGTLDFDAPAAIALAAARGEDVDVMADLWSAARAGAAAGLRGA